MRCGNDEILKKLVHGFVILHELELVLVVKLHISDFCCNVPYLGNEVVSAKFALKFSAFVSCRSNSYLACAID